MNEFIRPKKDSFPKIRDERYLIEQIKQDYSVLCKMWDITPQKGQTEIQKNEKIEEIIVWIKAAIRQIKIQKNDICIEGICWVGINEIEKEIERIKSK